MILPEIINPDGRPGPSECRVYTAQGGLLRTNYPTLAPCLGPYRANEEGKMSDPIARRPYPWNNGAGFPARTHPDKPEAYSESLRVAANNLLFDEDASRFLRSAAWQWTTHRQWKRYFPRRALHGNIPATIHIQGQLELEACKAHVPFIRFIGSSRCICSGSPRSGGETSMTTRRSAPPVSPCVNTTMSNFATRSRSTLYLDMTPPCTSSLLATAAVFSARNAPLILMLPSMGEHWCAVVGLDQLIGTRRYAIHEIAPLAAGLRHAARVAPGATPFRKLDESVLFAQNWSMGRRIIQRGRSEPFLAPTLFSGAGGGDQSNQQKLPAAINLAGVAGAM